MKTGIQETLLLSDEGCVQSMLHEDMENELNGMIVTALRKLMETEINEKCPYLKEYDCAAMVEHLRLPVRSRFHLTLRVITACNSGLLSPVTRKKLISFFFTGNHHRGDSPHGDGGTVPTALR